VAYYFTTPSGNDIPLIGVVDGNEVIVSPQITGRIVNLTVDEGTAVKKGELIAELDSTQLEASLAATKANVSSLEAQVNEANHNYTWTNNQTDASVTEARARVASSSAQLAPAHAQLWRDQQDLKRMQELFAKGEVSAQDRDHAEAAVRISQANVEALEEAVRAESAAVEVAQANRKQVDARKSAITTTLAQLEQARASAAEMAAQLGYTKIYAPIDGIVSVRVAKQGEVVAQGSPIVVIVDLNDLWVRADVEETYIDSIKFGEKLSVKLPSGDIIEGPVIFKGVENDFATQRDVSRTKRDIKTFAIKVAVPNPEGRLFTGMTATVLLPRPATKSWFARL
ncbi:MAG TPA: efflux RND transporter periplasmic adaptor subunit, partial [Candidatus Acidoferrales bacterium]|nr:efflux RND transporter periplasmic adaptor subunit [Candidatus Acidoferrales bacterium]